MPQGPKNVGRPRKYASKEEKAKQDVIARRIARRARRQPQSAYMSAQGDIRFRIYTAPQTDAMLTPSTQQTSIHSLDRLNDLANSTNPADPILTASCEPVEPHRNEAIPCNNELLRNTSRPATRFNTGYPQLEANETLQPGIPPSIEALRCNNPASAICDANDYNENNEIFLTSDYQSVYAHQAPAEPPSTLEDGPGTNGHGTPENLEERERGEDIIINQEEEHGTTYTNVEILPNEDSESEMGTEIDSLDEQDESGSTHELNDMSGSNLSLAKQYLERAWSCLCNCGQQESIGPDRDTLLGLSQMASYWRNLGLPDAIGPASNTTEAGEDEIRPLDWRSILSGGETQPHLCFEKSHYNIPSIQRSWDVDSVISFALCLSINRGLYVSYLAPMSRNMQRSVHVFHQGKPLHAIPHLRLGSGHQNPRFSVYVFFPGISHVRRTTSYLTNDERRMWIDRLLLPAIRHICPHDVIQHHPRSFDDI
ncbi:hypothetical protein TGAM01_v210488 [Trichoderma gamsii]|uniref:Uncharacterized protein n=1 Tax=Trichoderma gamsii TaxID=398673 RepID=A0A2P4Z8K5_9HYPO|nr:hypothetical protein TGAM01_v210488 [Trichoderma gamsii]PON20614.1 hypothetical protein TGAM01_v210488 [Trichoderma gamsii]